MRLVYLVPPIIVVVIAIVFLLTQNTIIAQDQTCLEIIPGHNNPDLDRINVVFVAFNMSQEDMVTILPYYVDFNGTGLTTTIEKKHRLRTEEGFELIEETKTMIFNGLLGIDPFSLYKDRFNFWYIPSSQLLTEPSQISGNNYCSYYCISDVEKTCNLPNTYPIYLCNANCQSYGSWGSNKAYLSHSYSSEGKFDPFSITMLVHEFGHSFGDLKDEYFYTGGKNASGYPNCAPNQSTAEQWWGHLVGQGEGDLEIGYFKGCSYNSENIRPSNSSIMKSTFAYSEFNLVCKEYLIKKLGMFTGGPNPQEHEVSPSR
ncbi:MAG: M64 family metallopeptidase [Candidatus Micrarchaeota archaeon]